MKNYLRFIHAGIAVLLGAFFIYAGSQKFVKKNRPPADNTELIANIQQDKYEKPQTFMLTVKSLKSSGFLHVVGIIQMLAGLLMLLPKTRLLGLTFLLPIILNIFLFHIFLNNKGEEIVESGIILTVNLILILFYHKNLKFLFSKRIN